MKHLKQFSRQFDIKLEEYLDTKIRLLNVLELHGGNMVRYIKEFIGYGGKRFRPALFFFSHDSFTKKKTIDSMLFSFIFELFHSFALIHDDIIDHSSLRRGRATIHTRYGLDTGILVGDFGLMLADEIFSGFMMGSEISEQTKKQLTFQFNRYKQELLVGQYLDTKHLAKPDRIMMLKTAQYSFADPVFFGLLTAQARGEDIEKWNIWMKRIGILFQMKDDYEGTLGDEKKTGKSTTSDIREGKNTHMVEAYKQTATSEELKKFNAFFGNSAMTAEDALWYKQQLKDKKIDLQIAGYIQKEIHILRDEISKDRHPQTKLHELAGEILDHIQMI